MLCTLADMNNYAAAQPNETMLCQTTASILNILLSGYHDQCTHAQNVGRQPHDHVNVGNSMTTKQGKLPWSRLAC